MHYKYFIRKFHRDESPNRRYFKVLYTAALRFGVVLPSDERGVAVEFDGEETSDVDAHINNRALKGTLILDGHRFSEVIVIDQFNQQDGKASIRTFWPVSQHPDAHESYTDPLVDTAIDGTPYDVHTVATVMHPKFQENAGVSPATLMKIIYEQDNELLRDAAIRIGTLLDEAHQREKEALSIAESYKEKAERSEKEVSHLKDELTMLQSAMVLQNSKEKLTEETVFPARAVTSKWRSKTGSDWVNIGIEAIVRDVAPDGARIVLTYIDQNNQETTISDFGRDNKLEIRIFNYLLSRKGNKAIFIVTIKPGSQLKLASNTMMLSQYASLWSLFP
jgi:hypothetical protein